MKFSFGIVTLLTLATYVAAYPAVREYEEESLTLRDVDLREFAADFQIRDDELADWLYARIRGGSPSPPPSPVHVVDGKCLATGMCKTSRGACSGRPQCDRSLGSKGRSCTCPN